MFDLETPEITSREIGKFTIKSYDPYGFWKVHKTNGGTVPSVLSGAYTSITEAEKAIASYERELSKVAAEVKVAPQAKK